MAPNLSANVLSSVPKHKEAVACFMEKRHMLDKLHSSMSYGDVNCEFNVNDSTIYMKQGVFKEKCTLNNVMSWLIDKKLWPEACRNLTLHFP